MFVIGATQAEALGKRIRELTPDHFYLVPCVGAQGAAWKKFPPALRMRMWGCSNNASRVIIYASAEEDFAHRATRIASDYHRKCRSIWPLTDDNLICMRRLCRCGMNDADVARREIHADAGNFSRRF